MREGWAGDEYLVLFSDSEVESATARYHLGHFLPGYVVVGLKGWDDIIVQDGDGNTYTVPSVPLVRKYLDKYSLRRDVPMETDSRFTGRIKWYSKPLVFGGDPNPGENVTWVTHEQHGELVVWWNRKYQEAGGA